LHRFYSRGCNQNSVASEFRREHGEGGYGYAVQRQIARHAALQASRKQPSKFSEIDYDAKSPFRQCSEIGGDFEELHSDLLTKPLSRFARAKP
jgi:hypothetical protein